MRYCGAKSTPVQGEACPDLHVWSALGIMFRVRGKNPANPLSLYWQLVQFHRWARFQLRVALVGDASMHACLFENECEEIVQTCALISHMLGGFRSRSGVRKGSNEVVWSVT